MRILLDDLLQHDLAKLIIGHSVSTVRDQGWSGIKYGRMLALAANKFDAFITADRNLEFQQNLARLRLAVVVPVAWKNRRQDLLPLLPDLHRLSQNPPVLAVHKVGA